MTNARPEQEELRYSVKITEVEKSKRLAAKISFIALDFHDKLTLD